MTPKSRPFATYSTPSAPTSPNSARGLIGLIVAFIIYGSLYPFIWDWNLHDRWVWWGRVSTSDALENIVLFLPLGWLMGMQRGMQRQVERPTRQWSTSAHAIWVTGLATILQIFQLYLPNRTPAFSDIVFNMAGWAGAWWLGQAMRQQGLTKLPQLAGLHLAATAIWVMWLTAELFPFVPTMDVQTIRSSVKMLWLESWWDTRRIALHLGMAWIGLTALAESRLIALLPGFARSPTMALWLCVAGVLFLKTITVQQSIGGAVVLGVVGGGVGYSLVRQFAPRYLNMACLWVALLTYLIYAVTPLTFQSVSTSMHWLPFSSWLENDLLGRVRGVAFEVLCYAGFLWSARRLGASLTPVAVVLVCITCACEFVQTFLVGRTGEMSSPVVVVLTAALLHWLERDAYSPRARPSPVRRRRRSKQAAS